MTRPSSVFVTNDVHSSLLGNPGIVHAVARHRKAGFLIADSGDFFEGTLEYELYGGAPELAVLASLYDVVAPGNHGFEVYEQLAQARGGPAVVLSNLVGWPGPELWSDRERGVLVAGIIGRQAFQSCSVDTSAYQWIDPVSVLVRARQLADEHSCTFVVLSHQGFVEDTVMAEKLAEIGAAPSAIFSGHCHTDKHVQYVGRIPVIKGREHGNGYSCYTTEDGAYCEDLSVQDRERRPHPLVRDRVYAFEKDSGRHRLRRHLKIRKSIAGDREALVETLASHLLSDYAAGDAACLNFGAVRRTLVDQYPWCSYSTIVETVPFDNLVERCELTIDAATATIRLATLYGEDSILVGTPESRSLATTAFLADRLGKIGLIAKREPTGIGLRELMMKACFIAAPDSTLAALTDDHDPHRQ